MKSDRTPSDVEHCTERPGRTWYSMLSAGQLVGKINEKLNYRKKAN